MDFKKLIEELQGNLQERIETRNQYLSAIEKLNVEIARLEGGIGLASNLEQGHTLTSKEPVVNKEVTKEPEVKSE